MYTNTINIVQSTFIEQVNFDDLMGGIQQIKDADVHGQVVWSNLNDIVDAWRTRYDSEPNILYAPNFTPNEDQDPDR